MSLPLCACICTMCICISVYIFDLYIRGICVNLCVHVSLLSVSHQVSRGLIPHWTNSKFHLWRKRYCWLTGPIRVHICHTLQFIRHTASPNFSPLATPQPSAYRGDLSIYLCPSFKTSLLSLLLVWGYLIRVIISLKCGWIFLSTKVKLIPVLQVWKL